MGNTSSSEGENDSMAPSSCDTGTSSDLDSLTSGPSEGSLDEANGSLGARSTQSVLGMKLEGFEKAMQVRVCYAIPARLPGAYGAQISVRCR